MTEMRQLDEVEKKFVVKQISSLKDEIEYQDYLFEHADLMLNKGLEQNYKSHKRDYKSKRKEAENSIKRISDSIMILEKQLKDGVEIKPTPIKGE